MARSLFQTLLTGCQCYRLVTGIGSVLLLWGCSASRSGKPIQNDIPKLETAEGAVATGSPLVDSKSLKAVLSQSLSRDEFQPELPATVGGKMLATAVQEQAIALEQLTIIASRPRQWRDGCLGIFSADELCIQVITPGWQGIISDGSREWVYHSDELGEVVKLNTKASDTEARISLGPLAQVGQLDGAVLSLWIATAVSQNEAIAAQASKEIAPTIQAILIDGSVIDLDITGLSQGARQELSADQIQAFDQQRNQSRLEQFDGLRYGSPDSATETFRVSLVDSQGIVQYDPVVQAQLPTELQNFNSAWQAMICSDPLVDCVSSSFSPALEAAE